MPDPVAPKPMPFRLAIGGISVFAACVLVAGLDRMRPSVDPQSTTGYRVDLNRSDAAELALVPGIGPTAADRILEHRRRVGPFRSVDQLAAVHRVGPWTVRRVRPFVTLGPPPDPAAGVDPPGPG